MSKNAILKFAVERGFLASDGSKYKFNATSSKLRENLLDAWTKNVQSSNRFCLRVESTSELLDGGKISAAATDQIKREINQTDRSEKNSFRPFCIISRKSSDANNAFRISPTKIVDPVELYDVLVVCQSKRRRLIFDQLLRHRQNWWSEIVSRDSGFKFSPSPSNSNDRASWILPFPPESIFRSDVKNDQDKVKSNTRRGRPPKSIVPKVDESKKSNEIARDSCSFLDLIEEIPNLNIGPESNGISAIRNTLAIEPSILALLEDGKMEMENEELGFRFHPHIAPYPIALINRDRSDQTSRDQVALEYLGSLVERILNDLGIGYRVIACRNDQDPRNRWSNLKAQGYAYGLVIETEILSTGVVRILHSDLDVQVETALPEIRTELLHRLGRR